LFFKYIAALLNQLNLYSSIKSGFYYRMHWLIFSKAVYLNKRI